MAAVVLEHHLKEVADAHSVTIRGRNKTIENLNDALREAEVIEQTKWRKIQFLADIRNNCDHDGDAPPTRQEVNNTSRAFSTLLRAF